MKQKTQIKLRNELTSLWKVENECKISWSWNKVEKKSDTEALNVSLTREIYGESFTTNDVYNVVGRGFFNF